MKSHKWFGVVMGFVVTLLVSPQLAHGEDQALKKRKLEAVEKFMVANRESDGDYTTVSLRDWQRKVGIPQISGEELIRKVLAVFDEYYKNLEILDYLVVYTNKPGPSGGIEYDFLIIRHETKPIKTYRFAKRKTDGGETVQVE
jgi:hypothetical protein